MLKGMSMVSPVYYKADGIDYLCIAGTPEELETHKRQIRQCLTWNLIDKLIAMDSITIPANFSSGIDYSVSVSTWNPFDPNYYPNLGFVMEIEDDFSGDTSSAWSITWNQASDFRYYLRAAICYSEEDFLQIYPPETYPLIKPRYDLVTKYMKDTYGIDLKAIAAK